MKAILLTILIILADQIIKFYTTSNIALGEARRFIPGFINLTYTQNTGVAFSLMADHPWFALSIVPVLLIALYVALWRNMFPCKVQYFAMVAIAAGGLSNWIDRLIHGFVVDMFSFAFVRFAVFNLADIFITGGAVLFVIAFLSSELRKKGEGSQDA